MTIDISARFSFALERKTDVLLQFEAAALADQAILTSETTLPRVDYLARVPAHEAIGERIWLTAEGEIAIDYRARVEINRNQPALETLGQLPAHELPGETIEYLLDSRYCPADRFHRFVEAEFAGLQGGARASAICQWIGANFSYVPGASNSSTTALDTFVERRGICRDYTHVLVSLARACGIPARYCSAYAPAVEPQDFHAVAELFLACPKGPGGQWLLLDPTGMAQADELVRIGVGRDAADVSFVTSFGEMDFRASEIRVSRS